ncbi:5-formyltetrahydrofolate cyclo-ligase [Teredinibacter sp. KSP-S5-2]|uniref:5-formyltetrahydrofolate cyclo-ligase n=1 Tax=Teredinibacter sp. KSP-S5-2 TaxID=3034506 RepID=UPI002934E9F6|nr:5-formyltetrahydrofolate cyclo-ligase [Teredinibacter sp. KSP-S5-2]WNO08841.1 5-formyltetrahydrofolate cyclo-ligase [Teredinibacter sp. KSP-S5-2]
MNKSHLRQKIRAQRNALSPLKQQIHAKKITKKIVGSGLLRHAKKVAVYLAADGEINTDEIISLCNKNKIKVFLPCIQADKTLLFRQLGKHKTLKKNRFGILEPHISQPQCAIQQLDIIFMPLVAFDRRGNRLGMGGGFYDRTLASDRMRHKYQTKFVGLAHAIQEIELQPSEWDVSLDGVVTEREVIWF